MNHKKLASSTIFFFVVAFAPGVEATIRKDQQHSLRNEELNRRSLQLFNTELQAPQRTCDQDIGFHSLEEIQEFAVLYANLAFSQRGQEAVNFFLEELLTTTKYGVKVKIICATCEEVRRDRLVKVNKREFEKFCGKRSFGSDILTSGVVIYPVHPDESPVAGSLKSYVSMHSFTTGKQQAPSGSFPDNLLAALDGLPPQELLFAVFSFYDSIAGIFAASSGAIAVLPDYHGYGQSFEETRLFFQTDSYKQAATAMWWKARHTILEESNWSQMIDPCTANTGGYSEGGAAAYVAAKALQESMDVEIDVVAMGAPALDLVASLIESFELLQGESASQFLPALLPAAAHSFSSINPDLPNSNVGQDALSASFQDPSDFLTDVPSWMQSEQNLFTLDAIVNTATNGNPFLVLNEDVIELFEDAIAADKMTDVCDSFAVKGETDLFCETLELQNVLDQVNKEDDIGLLQICHSPVDDTVFESVNRPDFSRENIVPFFFNGLEADGDHLTSSFICLYGAIFPFTDEFRRNNQGIDTNTVQPFADPFKCRAGKKKGKGTKGY